MSDSSLKSSPGDSGSSYQSVLLLLERDISDVTSDLLVSSCGEEIAEVDVPNAVDVSRLVP